MDLPKFHYLFPFPFSNPNVLASLCCSNKQPQHSMFWNTRSREFDSCFTLLWLRLEVIFWKLLPGCRDEPPSAHIRVKVNALWIYKWKKLLGSWFLGLIHCALVVECENLCLLYISNYNVLFLFWDAGVLYCPPQTALNSLCNQRLTLDSWSSHFRLLSARITDVHHGARWKYNVSFINNHIIKEEKSCHTVTISIARHCFLKFQFCLPDGC